MSGLSKKHETDLSKWFDLMIEVSSEWIAKIDPEEATEQGYGHLIHIRNSFIKIRNAALQAEDYTERQSERKT